MPIHPILAVWGKKKLSRGWCLNLLSWCHQPAGVGVSTCWSSLLLFLLVQEWLTEVFTVKIRKEFPTFLRAENDGGCFARPVFFTNIQGVKVWWKGLGRRNFRWKKSGPPRHLRILQKWKGLKLKSKKWFENTSTQIRQTSFAISPFIFACKKWCAIASLPPLWQLSLSLTLPSPFYHGTVYHHPASALANPMGFTRQSSWPLFAVNFSWGLFETVRHRKLRMLGISILLWTP